MIRNYIKTTLRSLLKNKGYSFLNIAGLAIGITCASLIFLWVQDEVTFNHNFVKRDVLFKVYENQTYEGKVSTFFATPGPFAKAVVAEIPGIKNAARMSGDGGQLFGLGDKVITEQGNYTDPALLSMLRIPFAEGSASNCFEQLKSVVISQKMAKTFFGDADPMGKQLKLNNTENYTVTGVFKDLPLNSTYQFQWLIPMANIDHKQPWMTIWQANWCRTLVELDRNASVAAVNTKLAHYLASKTKPDNKTQCFLYSMNDWNLRDSFKDGKLDGGRITYVRTFSIVAWVILLIACINFMNLATARSEQRAKEVGVRKVMGAGRGKLISQFIGEAVVMAFLAVFVAIGLIYAALPGFNNLVQKQLSVDILQPLHFAYLISIALITGLLAGSYPAFYLSSFNPVAVLKSIKLKTGTLSGFIRQSLVVVQFVFSIVFIIGTVIIYQQIQHIKTRDLGYNKNNLVYVYLQGDQAAHFAPVYNDLMRSGVVENACLSDNTALQIGSNTDNYKWEGKDASKNPLISWQNVSAQFISTMGFKLAAGHDFDANPAADSSHVIINEAFAKQMGPAGRVGGLIREGDGKPYTIIGILKDYLYNDLYGSAAPLILYNQPSQTGVLTMRFKAGVQIQDAIAKAGAIVRADYPGYGFEYHFIDDDFEQAFKTETLTGQLSGVFATLAIIISCLGLFGLAAYTAERRIKEIGIRKVLGATVAGLTGLISKDFLILVVISCLIAFPMAYLFSNNWLKGFQYHIDVQWWVFIAAGLSAMVIALATVSFQAIKAALMNPVKSLRSE